jgi:glutamine amidotransferase
LQIERKTPSSANKATTLVAVVDYGLGNLFSIGRALTRIGARADITSNPKAVGQAAGLILPGVGAFGDGMERLQAKGLIEPIMEFAKAGKPILGICLGMQLLFDESEEFGRYTGLGLIAGKVTRLNDSDPSGGRVKVPHIGWSEVYLTHPKATRQSSILEGVGDGEAMYFVHSYVPFPQDDSVYVASMSYGDHRYCAVAEQDNVAGVQFHPEKSGEVGLQLLGNFVERL